MKRLLQVIQTKIPRRWAYGREPSTREAMRELLRLAHQDERARFAKWQSAAEWRAQNGRQG